MRDGTPSATARVIAAATILTANDPESAHLVADGAADWCERFLRLSMRDRWLAASVRSRIGARIWRSIERATHRGIIRHWMLRKLWIEGRARAALREGFSQVVVLGAGLDTLAVRLSAERHDVGVLELDHPATQQLKRGALLAAGRSDIALVPCNLSIELPSWDAGELGSALDPARDTIVIAEGLLMYFDEARVAAILQWIAAMPCPRARLIFSFMTANEGRPIGFMPRSRAVEWWMAQNREPFRWALDVARAAQFMKSLGWHVRLHADASKLAAQDPGGGPAATGEEILEADRA